MAHKYGERRQHMSFAPCIDDYVAKGDPVSAYDVFVDSLDFNSLDVPSNTYKPSKRVTEYALGHATRSQCEHYRICCKSSKLGRTITRCDNGALRRKLL
jgi:hypothetical protein